MCVPVRRNPGDIRPWPQWHARCNLVALMPARLRSIALRRAADQVRRARIRRRVWRTAGRTHVELRALPPQRWSRIADEIASRVAALPGVSWVRANPHLGRLVVAHDRTVTRELLRGRVSAAERELGVDGLPFPSAHPEHYPGDLEPVLRSVVELGIDVAGLGAAAFGRRLGVPMLPIDLDLAAIISAVEGIPRLRKALERTLSIAGTELVLELAGAVSQGLLQGLIGPTVKIVHRSLRLRELTERRKIWAALESTLCADPSAHDAPPLETVPRPGHEPPGPIESYRGKAVLGSLSAFGLGLATTRRVDEAAAAVFAGLPRPAVLGRDAFASHLGVVLARRRLLVLEPHILRKLDRIDTIVVDDRVVRGRETARDAAELWAAARDSGLRVITAGERPAEPKLRGQWIAGGDALARSISELQRAGRAVCLIATGPQPAYQRADCAVGLRSRHATPPWGAHIFCDTLSDIALFIRAVAAARTASAQGVRLSLIEVGGSLLLALTGLRPQVTRMVMAGTHATSLIAMINGVRLAHSATRPRPLPADSEPTPWHQLEVDEVLSRLDSDPGGLSEQRAEARRPPQVSPPPPAEVFLRMVADELVNPLTPLLAGAAGLSALVGSLVDAGLIGAVVVANGVFGGAQRYRIERVLARLSADERPPVQVLRDRQPRPLPPSLIVPGDVVLLGAGEVVPADCRLVAAETLEVDESSLTGESLPVTKHPEPCWAAPVAERSSMLYAGTTVAAGTARAVVVAVGDATEARRALAAASDRPRSGVEARLSKLTAVTGPLAALGGLVLAGAGAARGASARDVLGTAISLAVAAAPEGLPLLATLAQLAAADRLSKRGALVRNPRAVEALGRVDILCADKTGTLTEGRIRLRIVSDGATEQTIDALADAHRDILSAALRASPSAEDGNGRLRHMTDRALIEGAARAGVSSDHDVNGCQRLHELPFAPGRAFYAGLAQFDGGKLLSVKGAPEVILPRCTTWSCRGDTAPLDERGRAALLAHGVELAQRGLRVLAVAERPATGGQAIDPERVRNMTFRGFVGLADPVRRSAREAIADLRRAGVEIAMLTGDHPSTAASIAAELGFPAGRQVMSGPELDDLDDDQLDRRIGNISVFARVTPAQKVRIVRSFQRIGRVVAMTGDGANDAPAIRLADAGIAVGVGASDAARHAADVVVTDERIETIVHAALEGRALWRGIREAVSLLVGGNLGEVAYTVIGGLIDLRPPLNARQLLLLNLVTDSLPALAIAIRSPQDARPEELMREGPDISLGSALTRDIAVRAVVASSAAGIAYTTARLTGSQARATTIGLLALTGAQLGQTIAAGTSSPVVLATGVGTAAALLGTVEIPGLSQFFGCRPVGPMGVLHAAVISAAATLANELLQRAVGDRRPYRVVQKLNGLPSTTTHSSSAGQSAVCVQEMEQVPDWFGTKQ
jgi:cation-transporting P-type ATPase I